MPEKKGGGLKMPAKGGGVKMSEERESVKDVREGVGVGKKMSEKGGVLKLHCGARWRERISRRGKRSGHEKKAKRRVKWRK